jgi:hypothetical protein
MTRKQIILYFSIVYSNIWMLFIHIGRLLLYICASKINWSFYKYLFFIYLAFGLLNLEHFSVKYFYLSTYSVWFIENVHKWRHRELNFHFLTLDLLKVNGFQSIDDQKVIIFYSKLGFWRKRFFIRKALEILLS